jgi:SET domain-containing protein
MNSDKRFVPSLGYLASTGTVKGLGVFASRTIACDEVIEIAPVVQTQVPFIEIHPELQRRVFDWERIASIKDTSAVALGYGSMYNHANPANMRYESAFGGDAIKFVSVREIQEDEELTINYNGPEPLSTEDTWFRMCGVVPIEEDKQKK